MGYATLTLAVLGFVIGALFRLQVLLIVIALLLLFSIAFSLGWGLSFFDSLMIIMAVQTVVQGSYFLGLLARAAHISHRQRHVL
jgi:hypothetical protein